MAPRKSFPDIALESISGDLDAGEIVPVKKTEALKLGRSSKGLQLLDPLVSIEHAIITFDALRGFVVEDLKSATGTWVDEECIKGASRPIGIGTRLRFGDSVFVVQPLFRPWLQRRTVIAIVVAAVLVPLVLFVWQGVQSPPSPELYWEKGVLAGGLGRISEIPIPLDFLRNRGIAGREIEITAVTDHDYDGRDEIWLHYRETEGVVEFDDAGGWVVLGEVPAGCQHRSMESDEFPALQCGGDLWLVDGGSYRIVTSEGVVVWYRPAEKEVAEVAPAPAKAKSGKAEPPSNDPSKISLLPDLGGTAEELPIEVGRFSLKSEDRMGAFLAARNINRPVHYFICEGAFEGIRSQALTDEGVVVDPSIACISDLRLEGTLRARPVAFALTAVGRQALIDDVTTFYSGNPDALFLDKRWNEVLSRVKADPGHFKGAVKLDGDRRDTSVGVIYPIPNQDSTVQGAHQLGESDRRFQAAPFATTATLVQTGLAELDPPGCSLLRIRTQSFQSYGLRSLLGSTFAHIEDIGCGEPRTVAKAGYLGGTWDAKLDGVDLRLVIEAGPSARGLEVLRARVTWRERVTAP